VVQRGYYAHVLGEAEHTFTDAVEAVRTLKKGNSVSGGWRHAGLYWTWSEGGEGRSRGLACSIMGASHVQPAGVAHNPVNL
jgi:hypothetical protein